MLLRISLYLLRRFQKAFPRKHSHFIDKLFKMLVHKKALHFEIMNTNISERKYLNSKKTLIKKFVLFSPDFSLQAEAREIREMSDVRSFFIQSTESRTNI